MLYLYVHCLLCYTWSFVIVCCGWQLCSFWGMAGDIGNSFLQTAVVLHVQLYPSVFVIFSHDQINVLQGEVWMQNWPLQGLFCEWQSSQQTVAVVWQAIICSCIKIQCGCITVQETRQVERNETWLLNSIIFELSVLWLCTTLEVRVAWWWGSCLWMGGTAGNRRADFFYGTWQCACGASPFCWCSVCADSLQGVW